MNGEWFSLIFWNALGLLSAVLLTTVFGYFFCKDGDKRKLMFMLAFISALLSYLVRAHEGWENIAVMEKTYYWSPLPMLSAVLIAALSSLWKLENFDKPFKTFLLILATSMLLIALPFPPKSPIRAFLFQSMSTITVGVLIYLVLTRRKTSDLMFLFSMMCFISSGLGMAKGLAIEFSVFADILAYVFLGLVFVTSRDSEKGSISSFFVLRRELEKVQKEWRRAEEKYRVLVENAPDIVFLIDARKSKNPLKCKYVYVSPICKNITGYSQKEFLSGIPLEKFIHPEDLEKVVNKIEMSLRGESGSIVYRAIRKDGREIWLSTSWAPVYDSHGKLLYVEGIHRDISEIKKAEQVILESRQKFEKLFMNNPEAAAYAGSNFIVLEVNPRFCELFGYSSEEVKGKRLEELILPEDKIKEADMFSEKAKKGYVDHDTVRKRKDGSLVHVSISAAPITIKGQFVGCVVLYKDITKRVQMENTLRRQRDIAIILSGAGDLNEALNRLLDNLLEIEEFDCAGFYLIDKDTGTLNMIVHRGLSNSFMKKVGHLSADTLYAKVVMEGKPVYQKTSDFPQPIRKDLESEGILMVAIVPIHFKGEVIGNLNLASHTNNKISAFTKHILETVGAQIGDAIVRLRMEKKLQEYSEHLEELVEKRTKQLRETQQQLLKAERLAAIGELAAMVGHDLRNPLTGIAGAVYYLKMKLGSKIDKKTKEMLELIERDVEYSNKIISDLLDYSREIRLELTETTPKSLIKEALTLLDIPENVQIEDLTVNKPKITVDVQKLKRAFINIIKNAVEAMPNGGALTITSKESNGNVEITFADTGVGMTKEVMEKLWTPLFTTKAKGMGFGLSICKRVVETHGGEISVESTLGKGTTFKVTLPIKPKTKGGENEWVKPPESLLSTTTKA